MKDAYGEEHFLHSLRHTCQNLKEDYRWYMVVKDTMYINSEEILAFLDTLYHADDFVFGKYRVIVKLKVFTEDGSVLYVISIHFNNAPMPNCIADISYAEKTSTDV